MTGVAEAGTGGSPEARRDTVDLHLHTNASDGMLPPEGVVDAAVAAGVSAIAITDHDTLEGVSAARRAGSDRNLRVIAGVELSAADDSLEVHVLGLHVERVSELTPVLERLREARVERARAIVRRLDAVGAPVSFERVMENSAGGAVGRPHVARALIEAGHVADFRSAFDRFLGQGRPAFVEKERLPVERAIAMVHQAGGLAVWAHPCALGTRETLERYRAMGMDGAEVLHPSHGPQDAARILELCESLAMVPSGGSDWHATPGVGRALGAQRVPAEWLERQDARLAERGRRSANVASAAPAGARA